MTTANPVTAPAERRMTWYGYLADENVEHIGERIRNLLTGRRYTFVSYNTALTTTMPDVRTGQRLRPEEHRTRQSPHVYHIGERDTFHAPTGSTICGITMADTYGVWGISSHHRTEREASGDQYATYVVIHSGRTPDDVGRNSRIEITQYNLMSPRERVHWVIAPEPPVEEEEQ